MIQGHPHQRWVIFLLSLRSGNGAFWADLNLIASPKAYLYPHTKYLCCRFGTKKNPKNHKTIEVFVLCCRKRTNKQNISQEWALKIFPPQNLSLTLIYPSHYLKTCTICRFLLLQITIVFMCRSGRRKIIAQRRVGCKFFSTVCRVGRENISCKNSFDSAPPGYK